MRSTLLITAALAIGLASPSSANGADGAFAGTYENESIRLELRAIGAGYEGTITVQGKAYPIDGRESGAGVSGKFRVGDAAFDWSARLEGETLVLESGGATHRLRRTSKPAPSPPPGAENPLIGLETVTAPVEVAAAPPTPKAALDALRQLGAPDTDPNRDWTILVYLTADNDLERFGVADLNEMEAGLPGQRVEVVVLCDRAQGYDESDGDWTDTRLFRVRKDLDPSRIVSPVLASPGELNMGDPAVLGAFIEGALKKFPARQTMLVMWDHGGGWASQANDNDAGGGATDDIKLPELRSALETGLKAAGVRKLDVIGFDMCLMAQLETATEVAGLADVMIASQALEPGQGWPYDRILPAFGEQVRGGRGLGRTIVAAYDAFYDEQQDETTTLAALDLTLVPDVIAKLDGLVTALEPALATDWPTAARALFYSESYMSRSDFRNGANGVNSLDLLDLLKRIRYRLSPFPAETPFRELVDVLDRFVVSSITNHRYRLSNGVAIYGPVMESGLSPAYQTTRFGQTSAWPKFLRRVHALAKAETTAPKVSNVRITDNQGQPVEALVPLAGHHFHATLEGRNIIWTQVWDGVRDPQVGGFIVHNKYFLTDDLWFLKKEEVQKSAANEMDLLMPEYKDGKTEISTEFDGLAIAVTNGRQQTDATLDLTDTDQSDFISSTALLEHASIGPEPLRVNVLFDTSFLRAEVVVAFLPQPDGRTQVKRIDLRDLPADARFTFVNEVLLDSGEMAMMKTGTLEWGQGLDLVIELMKPGVYEALLTVETMADVATRASITYRVEEEKDVTPYIANWQAFQPEWLAGTWDLRIVDQAGNIAPTTKFVEAQSTPQPGLFAISFKDSHSQEAETQLWQIDLRGMPNLRLIGVSDKGRPEGAAVCPAVFNIVDGKIRILTKVLSAGGMLWLWERREAPGDVVATGGGQGALGQGGLGQGGGANFPQHEPRFEPVQTPDPRPLQ